MHGGGIMNLKKLLSVFVFLPVFFSGAYGASGENLAANAVNAIGSCDNRNNIYDKLAMVSYERQKHDIWVQAKYTNFGLGSGANFNDDAGGLSFGYGREINENVSAGFFGKYDSHCASQQKSGAGINSYGIGAYGGYLYGDFDFKAILGLSAV